MLEDKFVFKSARALIKKGTTITCSPEENTSISCLTLFQGNKVKLFIVCGFADIVKVVFVARITH